MGATQVLNGAGAWWVSRSEVEARLAEVHGASDQLHSPDELAAEGTRRTSLTSVHPEKNSRSLGGGFAR